jgi:O-antigen ligase
MMRMRAGLTGMAACAIAVPTLTAPNFPPSATLVNQTLALAGWGATLVMMGVTPMRRAVGRARDASTLWIALAILAAATLTSPLSAGLPWAIGVSGLAMVAVAAMVAWGIQALDVAHPDRLAAFAAVALALAIAGLASAAIGVVQVFAPAAADGVWIATPAPGRATGNVRQPNHLASLLLWSMIAVTWLQESGRLRRGLGAAMQGLLLLAVTLSASRTGVMGIALLAAWGVFDRKLGRWTRWGLVVTPVLYAIAWVGLGIWAQHDPRAFAGEGRFSHGGDLSSSRFAIWSNALSMIARDPWTGVGFGEFNFAWTLTKFPDRPVAFFDHTHNLPLQLLVELGIPSGSLVILLLLAALLQAARRAWICDGQEGLARRAAFMMVLMISLHSMLEYPLWYAYFLLPTAFAWGFALSRPAPLGSTPGPAAEVVVEAVRHPNSTASRTLVLAGIAIAVGAAGAAIDYWRVVAIYDPPENAGPLEDRILRGQRSPLFGHHADYAAATAFGPPKAPLSPSQELAFRRAPHQLLDVRLMIAWSQALAAQGDLDKARWLAARIREFRNPGADEYFAPCQDPAQAARAFQCQAPTRVVHWREFVQR